MTFWMPLLFESNSASFIIVPLKDLGQQMGRDASNLGFSSISVDQESLLEYGSLLQAVALFFHPLLQDIAKSKYRVITISPKLIINPKFLSMFKSRLVCKQITRIIVGGPLCAVLGRWLRKIATLGQALVLRTRL